MKQTLSEQQQHVATLAAGFAKLSGWEFKGLLDDRGTIFQVSGPGNQQLSFRYQTYPQHRVSVSGVFPRMPNGYSAISYLPEELRKEHHSINVSPDKTAEQVAKDIQRRLMPGYLKVLEYADARVQEHMSYNDARQSLGERLADALEVPELRRPWKRENARDWQDFTSYTGSNPTVEIRPSKNDVDIKVQSCPPELAEQICRLVTTYRKGDKIKMS